MEKEPIKVNLSTSIILIILSVAITLGVGYYYVKNDNSKENITRNENIISNTEVNSVKNEESNITPNNENTVTNNTEIKKENNMVLYNGYEIKTTPGVQTLSDMKITKENIKKYNNITFYNYEKGKYVNQTKSKFGNDTQTYDGYGIVNNVKKFAFTNKFNAIPRKFKKINKLPNELIDMADYSSVDINSIDLDGDKKEEKIVCYTINYAKGDIGDGEPQATSGIILFDSNYKKIAELATLKSGFWGEIKEEQKKEFLSLDKVEYIDVDNDGIMEICMDLPMYEGTKLDIVKYNKGKLNGEKNYQVDLNP